jgi:serine/threonine-protein kinase RsbW
MDKSVTIQIHNKIPQIEQVCQIVQDFSKQHSISDEIIFTVHLALDEILTNIIRYGYSDNADHLIDIEYMLSNDHLNLKIVDDSNPFDPESAPPPDIDAGLKERKIGGLGIYLIKNLVDKIDYSSKNGKNTLILTKHFEHDKPIN